MISSSTKLRSPWFHFCLIAFLIALAYSNTLSVPFHFDDTLNIVNNPQVKDLANFWPPAGNRWFGYLTFALNYEINGLDTAGYHLVNIAIHIATAFLLYWLVLMTFRTPYFSPPGKAATEQLTREHSYAALFSALLFSVHPIQTQAVTYIVQRFASLAACFYLLSLATYIQARLLSQQEAPKRSLIWSLYAASLLAAGLATQTKETAFTLPAVVLLFELSFFRDQSGRDKKFRKLGIYLSLLIAAAVIGLLAITDFGRNENAFAATNEISRHDYLLTQFRVLVTYIRLLFIPVHQSIDYYYPLSTTLTEPAVLISLLLLAVILVTAVVLFRRSSAPADPRRLIAFGIFWFFITLSVESSIIPIADVIFEHRLYLPSMGASIAVVMTARLVLDSVRKRYHAAAAIAVLSGTIVVLLLSTAAYLRNTAWQSEISLWEDAAAKFPDDARAFNMLGTLYGRNGNRPAATNAYRTAIALKPSYAEAHVNLGNSYSDEGRLDDAMTEYLIAVQLNNLDAIDTAGLLVNMGNTYLKKGLPDIAIDLYSRAVQMMPNEAQVHFLLGNAYQMKGMNIQAVEQFRTAHQLDPDRF